MLKGALCFPLLLHLVFFAPGTLCFSQTTDTVDSASVARSGTNHSVYLYSAYSDNMVIASSVSHKQPYYSASLSYAFKNSFFLSASSVHIPGYNPFAAFNMFSAGYTHDFKSLIDVTLTMAGYKVPESLESNLFSSLLYGNLNLGVDWKILYTEVSASTFLSEGNGSYYKMKNSHYFQLPPIVGKKVQVSVQPYAELLFGSMVKIKLSEITYKSTKFPVARWGEKSWETILQEEEDSQAPESADDNGDEGTTDSGSTDTEGSGSGPQEQGQESGNGGPENSSAPQIVIDNAGTDQGGSQNPDPGTNNPSPVVPDGSGSPVEPNTGTNSPGTQENPENQGTDTGTMEPPAETGTGDKPETTTPGQGSGTDTGTGSGSGTGSDNTDQGKQKNPGTKGTVEIRGQNTADHIPDPVISSRITDFFSIMEIDFGLPVSISSGKFILELEPGYIHPFYNDPYVPSPKGFTFMVNFYWKLL